MKRIYYYQIIGKTDRYLPISCYVRATDMAEAKINFYIDEGCNIDSILRITKKQYDKAIAKQFPNKELR